MEVYEAREDSFLLKKCISKYAKGYVLDMGTGSGVLASEAGKSKKVVKVFGVDVNEDSIAHCIRSYPGKKFLFAKSDLFSLFMIYDEYKDIKFDLIMFNPPYLPTDPKFKDVALDGGKKGYELICKFMHQAKDYLRPKGHILLLFSSLTGKEQLEKFLMKNYWSFTEIATSHIFFEDLYVYDVMKIEKRKYGKKGGVKNRA